MVDVMRPQEIEVFVVRHRDGDGVTRQLTQHDSNIDKGIGAAVDKDDAGLDVLGRKLGRLVVAGVPKGKVIVEHLEGLVANDLKPMHDRLGAGERIEMRVRRQFLRVSDVGAGPIEEEGEGEVDYLDKDGRIKDGLPHCSRAEDAASAKGKEQHAGRRLDERIDDAAVQPGRRHGGRQRDKAVDLAVQHRVY